MMKLFLLYIVVLNMVITTAAETTNNRILLSSVLVGTALAASVSGNYDFSYTDLALLTTAVLVVNFPTNPPVPVQDSCTAPGYTADPLLGCYRVVTSDTSFVTYDQAKQECVNDGGRLLLINSEAEANALVAILRTYAAGGLPYWFIQGTRTVILLLVTIECRGKTYQTRTDTLKKYRYRNIGQDLRHMRAMHIALEQNQLVRITPWICLILIPIKTYKAIKAH
uniref:C-type lectin domain-containing protein n=1 Tax=Magallana gigas TaxID=29159 RepID=K1QPF4_MAGGI